MPSLNTTWQNVRCSPTHEVYGPTHKRERLRLCGPVIGCTPPCVCGDAKPHVQSSSQGLADQNHRQSMARWLLASTLRDCVVRIQQARLAHTAGTPCTAAPYFELVADCGAALLTPLYIPTSDATVGSHGGVASAASCLRPARVLVIRVCCLGRCEQPMEPLWARICCEHEYVVGTKPN